MEITEYTDKERVMDFMAFSSWGSLESLKKANSMRMSQVFGVPRSTELIDD